jgi:peroxiredoxin
VVLKIYKFSSLAILRKWPFCLILPINPQYDIFLYMVHMKSSSVKLNWPAVDFILEECDGSFNKLADFADKKGLLVIFTCNHCPYAKASWPVLIKLYNIHHDKINFIAINSNDSATYAEDSFAMMKQFKVKLRIPFPYLRDRTQDVARSYHALCTPDNYLFKTEAGKQILFYRGRINDNWQRPDQVTENSLEEAIGQLLQNKPPPNEQHASMGCSIKWK